MLRLFSKYLLIGLSAMTLLAGAQQGLFSKQVSVTQAAACDSNSSVDPETWSLIEEWECEPGNPGVKAHKWACFGDDGTPQAIKYTDGVSDTDKCPVETASEPPAAVAETPSQWECERALASGQNICNDNITFCEATGWSGNNVVSAVLMMKHKGVCDPSHGERDSRGCIFEFTPVRGFNYSAPQDASLFGAASSCPAETSAPAQGGQAPDQAAVTDICYVCDGGTWRQAGGVAMSADECSRIDNALFNQPNKPTWCQVPQEPSPPLPPAPPTEPQCRSISCASAPAGCAFSNQITSTCNPNVTLTCGTLVCQPGVIPPAVINPAPISITNNPVNTNTNTNTVTVNNPAPQGGQVREVVREVRVVQAAAGVGGNVGVGTTVVSGPVLVKELPKTGLPALAWTALAFVPTGFGLRRFSKIKKALQNHPSYIWEERQFRTEV